MRIAFANHGGKGDRLATALTAAGHELTAGRGDVAVVDHDLTVPSMCDDHERVVVYPHGGNPILEWDGRAVHPNVRLCLVHAPGHAQVMAAYGFAVPCVPVGWLYSDLRPPRYPEEARRVLFAPSHPLTNGYMPAPFAEVNGRILDALLVADCEVTVRCYGAASVQGLDSDAPVRWVEGGSLDTADIDDADLVIADGTMLHLAVARGVPAISLGADLLPDHGHGGPVHPARWGEYCGLMRYPVDFDDGPLGSLVAAVTRLNPAVAAWREMFVGEPFNAARAVALIETFDPARGQVAS